MKKATLIQQLQNTVLSSDKSLEILGRIIRKEFDSPEVSGERAMELLQLAYNHQIPQLDEMLNDYMTTDFKSF